VFNRVDFLRRALLCLNYQSVVVPEVIIADDGSDTDVLEFLEKIASTVAFSIKYVRQENKGFRLSKVRNNGVRSATHDFLLFLDQDIIYTHRFVETFAHHLKKDNFVVSWPIRLTEQQMDQLTDDMIKTGNYGDMITSKQRHEIGKQFRKDLFYVVCKTLHVRKIGPKLRGGLFAVSRENYYKVNGFDENYHGWGNEDDDLGRRFHAAGISGVNPFRSEYPLHMWHEPYREGTKRLNLTYYNQRCEAIHKGDFFCKQGIQTPSSDEPVKSIIIK